MTIGYTLYYLVSYSGQSYHAWIYYGASTEGTRVGFYDDSFTGDTGVYDATLTWDTKGNAAGQYTLYTFVTDADGEIIDDSVLSLPLYLTNNTLSLDNVFFYDLETETEVSSIYFTGIGGMREQLMLQLDPLNTTADREVTYHLSDPSVASYMVVGGEITIVGLAHGATVLKATAGGKTASISITVGEGVNHVHDFVPLVTVPTCYSAGYTYYSCYCGLGKSGADTPALGHDFRWVIDEPATTTKDGTKHEQCMRCYEERNYDTVILATGGTHEHSYTRVYTSATCTTPGYATNTCACGDSYLNNYLRPTGHVYLEDDAVAATCTQSGKSSGAHCPMCGEIFLQQETIPAPGHAWVSSVITTEPTATAAGIKTYICSRCKKAKTVSTEKGSSRFTDTARDAYYMDAVNWAVSKGITNGVSDMKFAPNATCTRGQIVTFLWRAAGEPTPSGSTNPFTDVKQGEYYYTAVLWAVENGITSGTSDTTFSPNAGCTRGQVATFLWRSTGEKAPKTGANMFLDVKHGEYYYTAVLWAVEKGITNGVSDTKFAPHNTCTRGQIVAFLYRNTGKYE